MGKKNKNKSDNKKKALHTSTSINPSDQTIDMLNINNIATTNDANNTVNHPPSTSVQAPVQMPVPVNIPHHVQAPMQAELSNNATLTGFDNLPAVFSSVLFPLCNENKTLRDSVNEKNIIINKLNHEADLMRAEQIKNLAVIKALDTTNNEYKTKIDTLTEKNTELAGIIKNLEEQIATLQEEIKDRDIAHKEEIKYQNERITLLEEDIKQLKSRDDPITVREAFVALERSILIEITGSKKKARYFNGLKDLFDKNQNKLECDAFLLKHNITRDHINLIPEIKDVGNISVHENRPSFERIIWDNFAINAILCSQQLDLDDDDKQMIGDLLKLLEKYYPVVPDVNEWVIKKPY